MQLCHIISPSPGMKATVYYIKYYVVCKNEYCWAYYKLAATQHQYQKRRNDMITDSTGARFWLKLKGENTY